MTITVELFDGTRLEFPDGTSQEVVRRVAKEQTMRIRGVAAAPAPASPASAALPAPAERPSMAGKPKPEVIVTPEDLARGSGALAQFVTGGDTPAGQVGEVTGGLLNAIGAGAMRGTAGLVGLPGTIGDALGSAVLSGAQAVGMAPPEARAPESAFSAKSLIGAMGTVTGGATDYRGETTPERFAGTVGEFLPGAAAVGGLGVGNLIRYGVVPGVASEAAGQMTEGTAAEPWARAGAAIAAPLALNVAERGIRAAISPYGGADPERLKLAKVLDDYGVPVTAGQRVGSEGLRRREGMTGAGQRIQGDQAEAFTAAVLKTAGINAKRATPDVLDDAAARIGQVFDDVTQGLTVTPQPADATRMVAALDEYMQLAPAQGAPPIFTNIAGMIQRAAGNGAPIDGATIKVWRSTASKLTRSGDVAVREAAIRTVEALDDMLASAMTAAGRPQDVARLATARGQYRNLLAIEKAASGAGEGAATGLLSPSAVRNAVAIQGRSAYATGRRGEIADLARAGEAIMKPLPRPGTAGELAAMGVPTGIGVSAGGAIGAGIGGPAGAAIGGLAGAFLPPAMRAMQAGPLQGWLANQAVGRGGPVLDPRMIGVIPGALSR